VVGVTQILALGRGGNLGERVVNYADDVTFALLNPDQATSIEDTTALLMIFIATLAWYVAHNAVWHVFRIDRVWRVILPPGLLLLAIIWQYEGSLNLDPFVIFFALMALLLIVRSHVDAREYEWYRNKVRVRDAQLMRQYFLRAGAALALLCVIFAWVLPAGSDDANQDRVEEFLESLSDITDSFGDLFSPVQNSGVSSAEFYGGDRLDLGGAIELGERDVIRVDVPDIGQRYYWRSTAYDTYVGGSWQHNRAVRATKEDGGLELNLGDTLARQNITQTVELLLPTSGLIYAAPQPQEFVDVGVRVELDCVTAPSSFECVNDGLQADASITRAFETIREGDEYTVVSSVSIATADQLRTASTTYPDWVTAKYLQGTEQVPRLQGLATEIVNQSGAVTPYDQAKAIERWLRFNITYNESIPFPPADQDPVEWVVFEWKQGYCNYYATAMVMMLRWQGIPARMSAGFSQGEIDPVTGDYLVREVDAHTWVEVYFPEYGWVNFEPTANEQEIQRDGDTSPSEPPPDFATTSTPPPPTVTPTPQPSFTPTAQDSGIVPQETQQNEQLLQPSMTPTPTLTPTPQATPIPLQDTQIDSDSGSSILQFLAILGLIVLVLLTVGTVVFAFMVWWVEHRGLGGLSMVDKAYARLKIYGEWIGVTFPADHTPHERRSNLVKAVPEGKTPISGITKRYVENRFAPPQQRALNEQEVIKDWQEARTAFIRRRIKKLFRR